MSIPNYTTEELKDFWVAECPDCKWQGLSRDCHYDSENGRNICPKCVDLTAVVAVPVCCDCGAVLTDAPHSKKACAGRRGGLARTAIKAQFARLAGNVACAKGKKRGRPRKTVDVIADS